jgi:superoxide dismutase, Fe-Mn family
MDRRDFLLKSSLVAAGIAAAPGMACAARAAGPAFSLPELGYAYNALEPKLDAMTMEIHHSKHHQGYVNNLNKALEGHALAGKKLRDILAALSPSDVALVNNGGGHANHSLFWQILAPGGQQQPSGELATAVQSAFGSADALRSQLGEAALKVFGSGWAWLSLDADQKLFISSTRNQENPLMKGVVERPGIPILGIDVWEHAYYLKFQNRRKDYLDSLMGVLNWTAIGEQYALALKG